MKLLEFFNDHLNDISVQENMFLLSRSIHSLHPDLIGATAHMRCYASWESEQQHHTACFTNATSRRWTAYLYFHGRCRRSVHTSKYVWRDSSDFLKRKWKDKEVYMQESLCLKMIDSRKLLRHQAWTGKSFVSTHWSSVRLIRRDMSCIPRSNEITDSHPGAESFRKRSLGWSRNIRSCMKVISTFWKRLLLDRMLNYEYFNQIHIFTRYFYNICFNIILSSMYGCSK
jgi:hypothetical protein